MTLFSHTLARHASMPQPSRSMLAVGALLLGLMSVSVSAQMALPSKLDVGQAGSASYTLPIAIVPGTSGMEPKLALTYDSQGGNGLMGMGWGISGLSAITRCPRTRAQDGANGAVSYDADDRFCLDGQRLILVGGTYGANNSEYRTEREEFSKIVATAIVNVQPPPPAAPINWPYVGPISFKVQTKAGVTMEFGTTADSAIQTANGSFRVWALSRVTDASGNYFTISYEKSADNSEYRPLEIRYTGNINTGAKPYAVVQFSYENRPDVVPVYQAGSLIKMTKRLDRIRVFDDVPFDAAPTNSGFVRAYVLSYETSPSTDRSRVTAIKLCALNECLPATTFEWSDWQKKANTVTDNSFDPTTTFSTKRIWSLAWGSASPSDNPDGEGGYTNAATRQRNLVDMNGDGKADIQSFAYGGTYWSVGQPGETPTHMKFGAPKQIVASFGDSDAAGDWNNDNVAPRMLADLNNDGFPDILGFASDGIYGALSNAAGGWSAVKKLRSGFGPPTFASQDRTPREFADMNGDGILDIVSFAPLGVHISLGTGGGAFGNATYWLSNLGADTSGDWESSETQPRFVVDLNGDGLPEVVGFRKDGVVVAKNTGASFSTPVVSLPGKFGLDAGWENQKKHTRSFVDMNGDGLPDLVGFANAGIYVALNKGTGTGFESPSFWLQKFGASDGYVDENIHPRRFADVNGDGLPDLVVASSGGIQVALSTGSSLKNLGPMVNYFGASSTAGGFSNQARWPTALADVNGDGYTDIVGFTDESTLVSTNNAGNIIPDLMISATSGVGLKWQVSYQALSFVGAPYNKGAAATFPTVAVEAPIYVATDLKATAGTAVHAHSSYRYEGYRANVKGRGLLGFKKVIARDELTKIEQATSYLQDFPFTGMPAQIERRYVSTAGATGVQLAVTDNIYQTDTYNNGLRAYVKLYRTTEKSWELTPAGLQGVQLPMVRTTYANDVWGNATQIVVQVDEDNDGVFDRSTTTNNEYKPADVSGWILGRLTSTAVTKYRPD
ncbi:FG-GAP-like repeat-containing protein [Lacibacterium aquatile]|uniref:FG-GAP-like repeat-containing protein n=1 Tax=Lacibacterium aquatile TaxID=1168082 RepID=A0ABW5DVD3_9PROT